MQKKLSAEKVLKCLIATLTDNLEELKELNSEFVLGEKYAYVECLEVIQLWEQSATYGLTGNPEEKYRVI